jgi:Ni,Fe-hydrogenase I cytochrome b subunit
MKFKSINYKKNKIRKTKFFFLFLFLICLFLTGFVVVDQNTRLISFGDEKPTFSISVEKSEEHKIKISFLGKEYDISIP